MHSSPPYTEYISTRWYRSPECLLTDGHYSEKMDIWSIGCIIFELYTQYPLFPGKNELDQISTIFSILGSPSVALMYEFTKKSRREDYHFEPTTGIGLETLIPDAPEEFLDLLKKML